MAPEVTTQIVYASKQLWLHRYCKHRILKRLARNIIWGFADMNALLDIQRSSMGLNQINYSDHIHANERTEE